MRRPTFAPISLLLSVATRSQTTTAACLGDSGIWDARDLWFSDRARAEAKYGPIGNWSICSTNLYFDYFFLGEISFQEDISGWDVGGATSVDGMFANAYSFDGDISAWDVGRVVSMSYMFSGASSFDADLSGWDVSVVTSMYYMFFDAESFQRGDLSGWDVRKVERMVRMFYGASSFDQVLDWCLHTGVRTDQIFEGSSGSFGICDTPSPTKETASSTTPPSSTAYTKSPTSTGSSDIPNSGAPTTTSTSAPRAKPSAFPSNAPITKAPSVLPMTPGSSDIPNSAAPTTTSTTFSPITQTPTSAPRAKPSDLPSYTHMINASSVLPTPPGSSDIPNSAAPTTTSTTFSPTTKTPTSAARDKPSYLSSYAPIIKAPSALPTPPSYRAQTEWHRPPSITYSCLSNASQRQNDPIIHFISYFYQGIGAKWLVANVLSCRSGATTDEQQGLGKTAGNIVAMENNGGRITEDTCAPRVVRSDRQCVVVNGRITLELSDGDSAGATASVLGALRAWMEGRYRDDPDAPPEVVRVGMVLYKALHQAPVEDLLREAAAEETDGKGATVGTNILFAGIAVIALIIIGAFVALADAVHLPKHDLRSPRTGNVLRHI